MQPLVATTMNAPGIGQAAPQPRLMRAAHEFEAQMMKELLKPMTRGSGLPCEQDDADTGSGGALGEFASEALGRALSEQGGLGIAHRIMANLSRSGNQPSSTQVTGNAHIDTGIRARK